MAGWQIRPLETPEDYRACVALQEETWGSGFAERVPSSLLKVSQRLGGVAAGAWDENGRMLGFVFGMTGIEHGKPVHWSDMLAVRSEIRDGGLELVHPTLGTHPIKLPELKNGARLIIEGSLKDPKTLRIREES